MNLRMLLPLLLLIATNGSLVAQAILDVTLLPDQIVRISWPASAGSTALESSLALGPIANWQPVNAPATLANGRYTVNFEADDRYRFFRLHGVDVAPQGLPRLEISVLPDQIVRLAWPASTGNAVLESSSALGVTASWQPINRIPSLANGLYTVNFEADDRYRFFRLRLAPASLATVSEISPAAGESGVAVTRETIFRFSAPLAASTVIGPNALFAGFGGRRLLSRAELSSDRRTLTLFYLENLPAGARVNVVFDGMGVNDESGQPIDADGDGQPGGTSVLQFSTAGTTALENTAVIGHVFASEPGTAGVNRPLEGAIVTVDGAEESLRAVTDATGSFKLQPAPAGRFFVHVDGRTAVGSQWPSGAYYPFVGKAWEAVPGRTNNLAGGTGEIFLPLIQADALKTVSATEETKITFVPSVLAANPALAGVEVRVPPNTLFSENGVRGGKVGIAPVPPDRLPEPLPPGLNLPIVITIQTDGPQNFDLPVPVRFPNLPDPVTGVKLGPGEKTVLLSFNHDTGRWEPQGTATITSDGNFAETDPGVGVRQPGWHGVSPVTLTRAARRCSVMTPCFFVCPEKDMCSKYDYEQKLEEYEEKLRIAGPLDPTVRQFGKQVDAALAVYKDCREKNGWPCEASLLGSVVVGTARGKMAAPTAEEEHRLRLEAAVSLTSNEQSRLRENSPLPGPGSWFVIRSFGREFEQRGRLNDEGDFNPIFLAPDQIHVVGYFDPASQRSGNGYFRSARAGAQTTVPTAILFGSEFGPRPDADNDGLSDDAEAIIGTALDKADTDGDGTTDYIEIISDTNPLDGQPAALGVIAGVNLNGSALAIGVQDDVAVVGLDKAQVAFIDVRNPVEPVLLGTFVTPGKSTGVAFAGNVVAVSTDTSGVMLFDLSNREQPLFLRQISGEATAIAASGERLYFGSARTLNVVQVDGLSPTPLSLSENLDDLQVFDGFLYVLMRTNLQVYAINGPALVARGSVAITGTPAPLEVGRKLFVGSGYAYVGTFEGWRVVDVRNPDALVVVGTTSTTQSAVHDLAFDGGQLLAITSFGGPRSLAASVYNARNPMVVTDLLASFDTPGDARAVALHRGYALVADSQAGLTIVSYLVRDRGTNPPSVTLRARFSLDTPPTQEGDAIFSAIAESTDDVLVRNVEFYVDDRFVATETSYPFEVELRAPVLTATKTSFTLRARAFDTGGNTAWSQLLTANLALDATPPGLLSFSPSADSSLRFGTAVVVSVHFNEPLAAATLNTGFTLINLGADAQPGTPDDALIPTTVTSIGTNEYALNFSQPLPLGTYAAKLGANLSDVIGNRLPAETSWRFHIQPLIEFVGTGNPVWSSAPQDAANWSSGRNPTLTDIIQIALPGNVVLLVSGQVAALDLTAKSPLSFGGGIDPALRIGQRAVFEAPVTLTGGAWQGGEVILRGETQIPGFMNLVDQDWNNEGHVTLGPAAGLNSRNSPGRTTRLRNLPGATWEIVDSQMGRGSLDSGPVDFENQGLLIARGTNRNFIGISRFINLGSVEVREGILDMRAGSVNGGASQHLGSYRVDAGATLLLIGLNQFGRATRIFGGGNVTIDGGLFPGSYELDGKTTVSRDVTFSGPVRSAGTWRIFTGHATFTGLNPEITGPFSVEASGMLTVAVRPLMRLNELSVSGDLEITTALEVNGPLRLNPTPISGVGLLGDGRLRANGPLTFAGTFRSVGNGILEIGGNATCQPGAQLGLTGSEIRVLPGGTFDVSGAERVLPRTLLINEGTLLKTDASTTLLASALENRSTVRVSAGTLQVTKGFVQSAGLLALEGGNLFAGTTGAGGQLLTVNLAGGKLEGAGKVTSGPVTNSAEIAPGLPIGILDLQIGNHPVSSVYQQTAAGKLTIDIAGAAPGTGHDQLTITGRALLDGKLEIKVDPAYDPPAGQEMVILTCMQRLGTFAGITGASLPGGKRLDVVYEDTQVKLRVIAVP